MISEIRLLVLLKDFEIGGIERSTIETLNHLTKKINFIMLLGKDGYFRRNNINENIKIIINSFNLYNPFSYLLLSFYIIRIIKKEKINLVHYHFRIYSPLMFFIKFFYKNVKIIYTHHSTFQDSLTKLVCAHGVISISESVYKDFVFYKTNKIIHKIISNGIEKPNFNLEKTDQFFNIAIVGRFEKLKGIQFVLDNINRLLEIDKRINVLFRGNGTLLSKIEHLANKNSRIKCFASALKIQEIFQNVDILLVPSIIANKKPVEGLPMVIIEAMMLKIPVLSAKIGGVSDLIIHNETGLLFTPGNIDELSEILNYTIKSRDLVRRITDNAYNLVNTKYNIKNTSKEMIKFYNEILN